MYFTYKSTNGIRILFTFSIRTDFVKKIQNIITILNTCYRRNKFYNFFNLIIVYIYENYVPIKKNLAAFFVGN